MCYVLYYYLYFVNKTHNPNCIFMFADAKMKSYVMKLSMAQVDGSLVQIDGIHSVKLLGTN